MKVDSEILNKLRNTRIKKRPICISINPDCASILDLEVKRLKCTKSFYLESLILAQYSSAHPKDMGFTLTVDHINSFLKHS